MGRRAGEWPQPRRGRPRLSTTEDTVQVVVRATESQREAWAAAASARAVPLSEWARGVLDRAARRPAWRAGRSGAAKIAEQQAVK